MSPENIATIRPVPRTTTLFTPVKASMIGVKMTPPPMPAMTEIMAMATLSIKKPKRIAAIPALAISPEAKSLGTRDRRASPVKEKMTETTIMIDSSQGERRYLLFEFNSYPS
jgi:hypothetical protein